ncbi:MAG: RNA polymerase sigma factor [Armatimonadetes bacterium]|nr:RNA polymerase sigma factor [Armatimonadota bacterium]
MIHPSDHHLIGRAKGGDGVAFEALHRRYFRAGWQFLYRQGSGREDADDLAAETFVRAYRALPEYRSAPGSSYLPFLIRVSSNLATDLWRKRQVELEAIQRSAAPVPEPVEGVALRHLAYREEIARVQQAIRQLPESDRQIIALCYEQELSGAQVAEILGKPTASAVTSHLNRALHRLRTAAQKQERQETLMNEQKNHRGQAASRSDDL